MIYTLIRHKMATYSKQHDLDLWKQWQKTKSSVDLSALLRQMDPIIQKEINRWSGVLARSVVEVEARRLAVQAFENYRDDAGAALSTHLTNYLQKLSRMIYTHQNLARIPEYQTLKINIFNKAKVELEQNQGRAPTTDEVAGHLGWSKAAVTQLQKLSRPEQLEFHDSMPVFGGASTDGSIDLVYHDLNPVQKTIFEHQTGYGGKQKLTNQELMSKLNITQGQLSYEKRRLIDKIKTMV